MTQKDQGEIVLDVFPEAVMRFAQGEKEEVKLALDGKNDFHAVGIMTHLAESGAPKKPFQSHRFRWQTDELKGPGHCMEPTRDLQPERSN